MPLWNPSAGKRGLVLVMLSIVLAACTEPATQSYQGYVEGEFVYIATSQPGRLDKLSVTRGQDVATGAPLFALEAVNEAAAQHQAQQQLAQSEAQLVDLQTGKRPPELDVTRAQLAQAEAEALRSAVELARDEKLQAINGISKSQLDDARTAANTAAAKVRELKSQLDVARLPGRDAQLKAQTAQVAAARAALAQADWKLAQKTVTAARPGRVFDTPYREGEWVAAGNPVVRLLPPQNVKVRFFVPETVLGSFKLGQAVTLRCDGCAATVPAKLTYIATEAEYTPPIIYSNETRAKLVFMIEAHPAPADASKLHPGQPVEVLPQ
ncbi:HlyD family secretion protein [Andreprevotia chitinilytica]|uniref:HlyD family secretion protein n=1 Tax=Andreprevotia chitinilytica TaxID=396808 RepID=UPI0005503A8F|nr:HlyD family secretion protein [Andreprevotia chitinilytica]